MRILVLGGAGAMGTEATRDLAESSVFEEIAVGDIDLGRAEALRKEIGSDRIRPFSIDVADEGKLPRIFEPYDVILNCTSYVFGLGITRAAIDARRPILDLGGLYNTPKQLALGDRAKEVDSLVVLGMGATPGVTNLMARDGANHLDAGAIHEIEISFASFRAIAPSPGLLSTVLDEFSPGARRFFYDGGDQVEAALFEGERIIDFAEPVGSIPAYFVPHSEIHTLPRSFPSVRRVSVRGTWQPEIMKALRQWGEVGLLSRDPVFVHGAKVEPREVLASVLLRNHPWPKDDLRAFFLHVAVVGERGGVPVRMAYRLSHPTDGEWRQKATGRVTGIPASIGAQKVAAREILVSSGVFSAESVFEPTPFFDALERRQLHLDRLFDHAPQAASEV